MRTNNDNNCNNDSDNNINNTNCYSIDNINNDNNNNDNVLGDQEPRIALSFAFTNNQGALTCYFSENYMLQKVFGSLTENYMLQKGTTPGLR